MDEQGAREGGREGRREGVRSTPLLGSDHTSPDRRRVNSSHITQEGLLLQTATPEALLHASEERGSSRALVLRPSLPPCSVSSTGKVRLSQLLFSK